MAAIAITLNDTEVALLQLLSTLCVHLKTHCQQSHYHSLNARH